MSGKRIFKVLLVGAAGYQRASEGLSVSCFSWSQISRITNIRDYDNVVLNLLGLEDVGARDAVDWHTFEQILTFAFAIDVLRNGGTIIVVGDPRFLLTAKSSGQVIPMHPFLTWTGANFAWDPEPGDTVRFVDSYDNRSFADYASHLRQWDYSLGRAVADEETLKTRFKLGRLSKAGYALELESDVICYNRYRNALLFVLRWQFTKEGYRGTREVLETLGPIVFLPRISLGEDETLQVVLRDLCGVEAPLPEPEWLQTYSVPGQQKVDEEILQIRADVDSHLGRLRDAEVERTSLRQCLKLLYERETVLEPVVREILRRLGAHVEDPTEPNKEDGWVVIKDGDDTLEGVLEIKSTRADQFSEDGRKQLLDWVDRGRTLREKNYKGIFIGSNAVDKPLPERPWAFSDSWAKAASLSNTVALKTEDVYLAYFLSASGKIQALGFWRKLFSTSGILDMREYRELLRPSEER
jgi:hypothetical protein